MFIIRPSGVGKGAQAVPTVANPVDIGTLIAQLPDFKRGRPHIAGSGVTVQTLATHSRMGESADDIARKYSHLTPAQVYAALAYYHPNRATIDAAIDEDDATARRIEMEWRGAKRATALHESMTTSPT